MEPTKLGPLEGFHAIESLGVELEGHWEWSRDCEDCYDGCLCGLPDGIKEDGSVHADSDDYAGEIASHVFRGSRGWTQFVNWAQDVHPDRVDQNCGLHFHVGMKSELWHKHCFGYGLNENVARSMASVSLDDTTREWLHSRIETGRSTDDAGAWCKVRPPWQRYHDAREDGDRYYRINPCSYRRFQTLEVRLAPMGLDARESIALVHAGARAVDRWIVNGGEPRHVRVAAPAGITTIGQRQRRSSTGEILINVDRC